jgi:hypothetical protein
MQQQLDLFKQLRAGGEMSRERMEEFEQEYARLVDPSDSALEDTLTRHGAPRGRKWTIAEGVTDDLNKLEEIYMGTPAGQLVPEEASALENKLLRLRDAGGLSRRQAQTLETLTTRRADVEYGAGGVTPSAGWGEGPTMHHPSNEAMSLLAELRGAADAKDPELELKADAVKGYILKIDPSVDRLWLEGQIQEAQWAFMEEPAAGQAAAASQAPAAPPAPAPAAPGPTGFEDIKARISPQALRDAERAAPRAIGRTPAQAPQAASEPEPAARVEAEPTGFEDIRTRISAPPAPKPDAEPTGPRPLSPEERSTAYREGGVTGGVLSAIGHGEGLTAAKPERRGERWRRIRNALKGGALKDGTAPKDFVKIYNRASSLGVVVDFLTRAHRGEKTGRGGVYEAIAGESAGLIEELLDDIGGVRRGASGRMYPKKRGEPIGKDPRTGRSWDWKPKQTMRDMLDTRLREGHSDVEFTGASGRKYLLYKLMKTPSSKINQLAQALEDILAGMKGGSAVATK